MENVSLFTKLCFNYGFAAIIILGLIPAMFVNARIDNRKKKYLLVIMALVMGVAVAESLTQYAYGPGSPDSFIRRLLDVLGYNLRPIITIFFFYLIDEDRNLIVNHIVWIPEVFNLLVCCTTFWSDIAFGYTYSPEDGWYFVRGTFGFTPHVVTIVYLVFITIVSLRCFQKESRLLGIIVIFCVIVIICGIVFETVLENGQRMICNAIMLSCLFYFLMIYMKASQRREEELISQNRMEIMISQIRPHFIFNTLTAIYGTVDKDPELAKEAISEFSKYLRTNMEAMGKRETITFDEELEHVQTYVWIEKLRFGNLLDMEYDLNVEGFKLPFLTVQPLVENAIKHGIGKKEGGGCVKLSTYETDEEFFIVVSDNGVGFNPETKFEDGREHIGINNIKERLYDAVKGELEIKSVVGEGTTARIRIPK